MLNGMSNDEVIQGQMIRAIHFDAMGVGYGREIPAGAQVTVVNETVSEQRATYRDGDRVYTALVNHDDYLTPEQYATTGPAGSD